MNKQKNNISQIIKIVVIIIFAASCQKGFLEEELKTSRDDSYFKTEEGVGDAVIALYEYFRFPFKFEYGYSTTSYGTDEFTVGGDNSNHDWNDYTANLSPSVVTININTTLTSDIWDGMYEAINMANIVLANADEAVADAGMNTLYKAEASFCRAFSYFKLVEQYGAVVLKLEPSTGVDRNFVRASIEECVNQVISDYRVALEGLPETETAEGKLYKDVARHFLAKALLYRVSEINDDWNTSYINNDLDEIISLSNVVIQNHALTPDFKDVFDFQGSDGDNEQLPEIIFAAQFSNANTSVQGNHMHTYFISQYNNLTGFTRDIAGGREYQRLRPSDYLYDVFDMENDSRFWKSFRTKQNLNKSASIAELDGSDGNSGNDYTYSLGDLGLIYIINMKGDARFDKEASLMNNHTGVYYLNPFTGKPTPHTYVRYFSDGSDHLRAAAGVTNRFPSVNKWLDGARINHNYTPGSRDGILARVSETYLIKAEALIRQGNYNEAIDVINVVRERAQFKSGEDRAAYTDGAAAYLNNNEGQANYEDGILCNSFASSNSYYESNNIAGTTAASDLTSGITVGGLPPEDEAIIAKLGYSSNYDRMMCFLLNERSRELVGEFLRWQDLARTKTLIDRAKAFNPDAAANISEKHYVRPIPQTFLDAITDENGNALSASEKDAMQNPGY